MYDLDLKIITKKQLAQISSLIQTSNISCKRVVDMKFQILQACVKCSCLDIARSRNKYHFCNSLAILVMNLSHYFIYEENMKSVFIEKICLRVCYYAGGNKISLR